MRGRGTWKGKGDAMTKAGSVQELISRQRHGRWICMPDGEDGDPSKKSMKYILY